MPVLICCGLLVDTALLLWSTCLRLVVSAWHKALHSLDSLLCFLCFVSNIDLLAQVDAFLVDKSLPIWKSLSAERMELYRDIRTVTFGSSPHLERCAKFSTPLVVHKQLCY